MDDKKSILEKIEDTIKGAATAVEEFADKVSAPEEPIVVLPEEDTTAPSPVTPVVKKDGA